MLTLLTLAVVAAGHSVDPVCQPMMIASGAGENHVMFHGVSPDGRSLAIGWDKGTGPDVQRGAYLLELATGKRTPLPRLNNAPSFSPEGRFLVAANYASDKALRTEVVELDRRTGAVRTYASAPSGEWLASYSSNGRSILFNSTRSGRSDLYSVNRTDGTLVQITADPRYEAHGQWFNRDRKVAFHRQSDGDNYDIVVRDLRSGAERLIGATPAEEAYPAISPDGRWIAFSAVTSPGTQPNLFIMRADGTGRSRLTQAVAKDAYATWSPDGRSLFFVRFANEGSAVYRLAMNRGRCGRG